MTLVGTDVVLQVCDLQFGHVLQPFSWMDLCIPFQGKVALGARVSWSNRWLLEQAWPFPCLPRSLSLPCSCSPRSNPTAVLMVTLFAKTEGLDFYRTHELSIVPAVDTVLQLPPTPSLLRLHLSFSLEILPPGQAEIFFVSFICLDLSSAHLSSRLVASNHPFSSSSGCIFQKSQLTGLYQLACLNLTKI